MSDLLFAGILLYRSRESASHAFREYNQWFSTVQTDHLKIFYDTYTMLSQMSEEAEDDEMLPLSQIGLMMVDWIDPFKALWVLTSIDEVCGDWSVHRGREGSTIDTSVHLDLSIEVLKLILMETSRMYPGMLLIKRWWRKRKYRWLSKGPGVFTF